MDQLNELASKLTQAKAGYRQTVRETVTKAYEVAKSLMQDRRRWDEFCKDKWWQERKKPPTLGNQKDALRFVLRKLTGEGPSASKRANRFYLALAPLMEKGVPSSRVPEIVKKAGGWEKLAKKHKPSDENVEVLAPMSDGSEALTRPAHHVDKKTQPSKATHSSERTFPLRDLWNNEMEVGARVMAELSLPRGHDLTAAGEPPKIHFCIIESRHDPKNGLQVNVVHMAGSDAAAMRKGLAKARARSLDS